MRWIVYSHSTFSDILQIQERRLKALGTNYDIIIDDNSNYVSSADRIYCYNNEQQYSTRLLAACLKMHDEYILLIHDNDVMLSYDSTFLKKAEYVMRSRGIDRIDVQHYPKIGINETTVSISDRTFISKTSHPGDHYVYNVQPSIWKRESLIRAMSNFKDISYKDIESTGIQKFCSDNFNMYRTATHTPQAMGYYTSAPEFVFMHLTHHSSLLPVDSSVNQMCEEGQNFYKHLIENTDLTKGTREFRITMY